MGVIAKSEWRGGEQKKLEKLEFDMPTNTNTKTLSNTNTNTKQHSSRKHTYVWRLR